MATDLVDNLKITTMTVACRIKNLIFDERYLSKDTITAMRNIINDENYGLLCISSNFIDPIYSDDYNKIVKPKKVLVTDPNVVKRGRKKKDISTMVIQKRKSQGSGKHFNSQITFIIKSKLYENKYYDIKVFRTGYVGIPGGTCMKDISLITDNLIKSIRVIFNNEEIIKTELTPKMTDYKTHIPLNDNQMIDYVKLKYLLMNDKELNCNECKILTDKNNSLILRPTYMIGNVKKQYLIEMFLSGKVNIKGIFPKETMMEHITIIQNYINEHKLIVTKFTVDHDELIKIIHECSDTIIEPL